MISLDDARDTTGKTFRQALAELIDWTDRISPDSDRVLFSEARQCGTKMSHCCGLEPRRSHQKVFVHSLRHCARLILAGRREDAHDAYITMIEDSVHGATYALVEDASDLFVPADRAIVWQGPQLIHEIYAGLLGSERGKSRHYALRLGMDPHPGSGKVIG